MPIYQYKNKKSGQVVEVFRPASEYKDPYLGEDGKDDPELWEKVVTCANLNTHGSSAGLDPFSAKDFEEFTKSKKGTYGDLLDLSEELSQRRAEKVGGVDPIKEKYNKKHGIREEVIKVEHEGVEVEFEDSDPLL